MLVNIVKKPPLAGSGSVNDRKLSWIQETTVSVYTGQPVKTGATDSEDHLIMS